MPLCFSALARFLVPLGVLALGWVCALVSPVLGQPMPRGDRTGEVRNGATTAADDDGSAGGATPRLVEQTPQVIYVRDEQGELVPLINVPLETIQELLDQRAAIAAPGKPPEYQITEARLEGEVLAEETAAELELNLRITVLGSAEEGESRWTAVPLRLHDAALLAPAEHEGEGQVFVEPNSEQGYRLWLRHSKPGDHRVTLRIGIALNKPADSTQLRLFPPLANQSRLNLTLPGADLVTTLENGRTLRVQATEDDRTRLDADDLKNQVIVTWRPGSGRGPQRPTFLDVQGDIRVTIDGPGAIRSNVTLDLEGIGQPIERFSILLPPNTEIVSGNQPGYTLRAIQHEDDDRSDRRRMYQVELEKPALQTRLQLATQTTDNPEGDETVNVANFEVVGAIRQSGFISLRASDEWLIYWQPGPSVRRIPNRESMETLQERRLLASFRYFRQPSQLAIQVRPQGRRLTVEPVYRMRVSEDRISLEAELKYRIRGARVSFIDFDLKGWQLDDIGPSGTVENDDLRPDADERIKLRLTKATSGDLTLNLNLHRPLTGNSGALRFPLPQPLTDETAPGTLLVRSADAVVLEFDPSQMKGLTRDPLLGTGNTNGGAAGAASDATAAATDSVAAFRVSGDREVGEVAMSYEIRSQEILVRSDAAIDLTTDTAQVSQRFAYRIRYQPASRIRLEVPEGLFELLTNPRYRSLVDARLDGVSLGSDWLQDGVERLEDAGGNVPISIPLGGARLGSFDLELRYPWALRSANSTGYTAIPLAVPDEGLVVSNTATLSPVGPLRVEPASDGNWIRDDSFVTANSLQAVGITAGDGRDQLRVRVSQLQEDVNEDAPLSATVVQLAWLRTWLSNQQRMDRAVFRFVTGAEVILVKLPPDVASVDTLVDGQPLDTPVPVKDQLVVPLPRGERTERTLELSLEYKGRPGPGAMKFQPPVLLDAVGPRQWFWQFLVPANEHLLAGDARLTSANRWVRHGLFFRRQASEPQAVLEFWTHATRQPPVPQGLNQYLFSSLDRIDQFSVRTCPRYTLVYLASTATLAIGLLFVYVPQLRHPVLLFIVAVVLIGTAWLHAETALVIGQAGFLGVVLVLLAMFTSSVVQHLAWRRATAGFSTRRAADSRSGVPSPWRESSLPQSTITAPPASFPSPAPDSNG